jgi:hypothetical protein
MKKETISTRKRNSKTYTGIGARKTPAKIQKMMLELGLLYGYLGYTLRSGGAEGADTQFEAGHRAMAPNNAEIFLPWDGFNKRSVKDPCNTIGVSMEAYTLARKYHPAWDKLSQGAKKMMARNAYQLLGPDLNKPTELVICWTPGAKIIGGTGQALRMAKDYNITIANLADKKTHDLFMKLVEKFLLERDKALANSKI